VQLLGFPTDVLNSVMSHAEQVRTHSAPKSSEASTAGFAFTSMFDMQTSSPPREQLVGFSTENLAFALSCASTVLLKPVRRRRHQVPLLKPSATQQPFVAKELKLMSVLNVARRRCF